MSLGSKVFIMQKRTLALACVAAFLSASVLAQPAPAKDPAATPQIDKRIANQEKRIEQGAQSGALTPRETKRLEQGEIRIKADETAAKADGKVTRQERQQLQRELNQESRAIAREKHDRQRDRNHDGHPDHPQGKHRGH